MTQLEINPQTAEKLQELSKQAKKSVDEILLLWLNNFKHTIIEADPISEDAEDWTEEELAELFKPKKPLTGKQIVEKHLKSGVIGSWADEDITDGAEWVNQQKEQQKGKYRW